MVRTLQTAISMRACADTYANRIQHEPEGRAAGLTTPQLLEVRFTPPFFNSSKTTLTPELVAARLFADYSTLAVRVPDAVFKGLKAFLNDTQLVEATSTVGFYNFVSRFLLALDVDGKMDLPVPIPT